MHTFNTGKTSKKRLSLLLAFIMLLGMIPGMSMPVAAADTVRVIIDFEGYNLGQGFYIEPTLLEVPAGSNAAYVTDLLLSQTSHTYSKTGSVASGFYLSRIQGFDTGTVVLPAYLEEPIEEIWDGLDPGSGNGSLGEYDYCGMSGWMLTANHEMLSVGASDYTLQDGDVIRWQFTIWGIGTDLGVTGFGGPPLYTHADKTELFRALMADGANEAAKTDALAIIINPLATEQEVTDAIAALAPADTSAPLLTGLSVNGTPIPDFAAETTVYDVNVKGNATSSVAAAYDSSLYSLTYNGVPYDSGTAIPVATAANSGVTTVELILTDTSDAENKTFYTLKLLNPRTINLSSKFDCAPTGGSAYTNILINGRAEGIHFQADAAGVAGTSVTFSAAKNDYRIYLLTATDKMDITMGNFSTPGYIRVLSDGNEILAPRATANSMILSNLDISGSEPKLSLELCSAATYAQNGDSFVAENCYNVFVDKVVLPADEFEKAKISEMTTSAGNFTIPFYTDIYMDTIWLKGEEGTPTTLTFKTDSGTQLYKSLTSSTGANTLTPTDGVYTFDTTIATPFQPNLLVGYQFPFATERVINGYTIRVQYKILCNCSMATADFTVVDYMVPASQYTNRANYGMYPEMLEGGSLRSLGNFGGYITLYFEDAIENSPNNPNGVDFYVSGNSVDGGPGFSEPGNVWVSVDGAKWYLLAGSDYFDDNTYRDYTVTYTRAANGGSLFTDNYGGVATMNPAPTDASSMYNYPLKKNYPLYNWQDGEEDSMTFTGPLLTSGTVDAYGSAQAGYPFFGYVDVAASRSNPYATRGECFDLDWAIDTETGKPVSLDAIQYVKISSASHVYAGAIGEKSTEVAGAESATPEATAVGVTAAPTAIKINDTAITLENGVFEYTEPFGDDALTVKVEGTGSANVFINNASGTARTFATVPLSGTVRIIVQDAAKEPVIYYITNKAAADKTALSTAIATAEALVEADYTTTSWAVLDTALTTAKATAADTNATQEKVDEDKTALTAAIAALRLQPFLPVTYSAQMEASLAYILSSVPQPGFGTGNGEWSVLTLARAGVPIPAGYYEGYIEKITQELVDAEESGLTPGQLDTRKATENERLILALAALGKNPANVGGYNLLEPLANFDWTVWQGLNGTTFALIALDANKYEIPGITGLTAPVSANTAVQTTRQKLIDELLDLEINKGTATAGGWAQSSTTAADVDGTAQVLQALAPYYGKDGYENVTAAVDRGLLKLSSVQNANGGFASWGTVNAESCAQVIVALTALDIDPQTDVRFVKQYGNPISALLTFYVEGGGFTHIATQSAPNNMATDQGTYALVAYDRFKNGKTSLYDMSDVAGTEPIEVTFRLVGTKSEDSDTYKTWIATKSYTVAADSKVADVLALALAEANLTPTINAYGYVSAITAPSVLGGYTLSEATIGEYPDATYAGWMFSVNNILSDAGMNDTALAADDAVVFFYSGDMNDGIDWMTNDASGAPALAAEDVNPAADKTALTSLITQVEALNISKYTTATWNVLQTALTAAKETVAKTDATQPEADNAKTTLQTAVNNLMLTGGGTTTPSTPKINVSFRLIGASKADGDIDLSSGDYKTSAYGTWIATKSYSMNEGDTVYDLFVKAIDSAGLTAVGANNNYVKSITAPASLGGFVLGEFTNGKYSGWMYTINGKHPGYGLKEQVIKSGDVVVWHYVNDYRHEVEDWFDDANYPALGNGDYWSAWLKAADKNPSAETTAPPVGTDGTGNATPTPEPSETPTPEPTPTDDNKISWFADVNENDWFYDAVKYVFGSNLMKGVSDAEFTPNDTITRAMLVTILYRYENTPAANSANPFSDVDFGQWYSDATIWAAQNGIVKGVSEGIFAPNDSLTREQIVTILYRYAQKKELDTSKTADLSKYTDASEISDWAKDAMTWANAEGIMNGRSETTLAPGGTATRAEVAALLMRFIEEFVK